MAKLRFRRVRSKRSAHCVLVLSIYGWRGDKPLKRRTIKGYYQCNEAALWSLENCCQLHHLLTDRLLAEYRSKAPAGQRWDVSETWTVSPNW